MSNNSLLRQLASVNGADTAYSNRPLLLCVVLKHRLRSNSSMFSDHALD